MTFAAIMSGIVLVALWWFSVGQRKAYRRRNLPHILRLVGQARWERSVAIPRMYTRQKMEARIVELRRIVPKSEQLHLRGRR